MANFIAAEGKIQLAFILNFAFWRKSKITYGTPFPINVEFFILTGRVLFSYIDITDSQWMRFLFTKTEILLLLFILGQNFFIRQDFIFPDQDFIYRLMILFILSKYERWKITCD